MTRRDPSRALTFARLLGAACVLLGSLGWAPVEVVADFVDDHGLGHHHGPDLHGDHAHGDHEDAHRHDGSDLVDHEHTLVDFDCGDAAMSSSSPVVAAHGAFPAPDFTPPLTDSLAPADACRCRGPPPPRPWQLYKSTIVLTV